MDGKAVRRNEVDCICRVCEGFLAERYLGKPHYEREIMDAGLVMKTRAFAATWVDSLQTGTLKSHRQHEMRSQGSNQFSCDVCLVAAPNEES
jgi:hypothetical protein